MRKQIIASLILTISFFGFSAEKTFSHNGRQLTVDNVTGAVTIVADNDTLVKGNLPAWGLDGEVRRPDALQKVKITSRNISDVHGNALRVSVAGVNGDEKATVDYDIYPDFLLTRLSVEPINKKENLTLNYLAPISTRQSYHFTDRAGNYALSVPYDNDAWVRYTTTAFGDTIPMAYEVAALFNADTRRGLIVGSVEHDLWKTGIKTTTDGNATITSLEAFAGVTSELTRDRRSHGHVSGNVVKSSRIILVSTDDWRDGMELFADQCAAFAPAVPSKGPRPFGWNSWGKMQTKLTYQKALEVSDFIHKNLSNKGFKDADGKVCINLDAFWDFGFKHHQHREFVAHCKANGQMAGLYFCPFTDWSGNPESVIREAPEYKMKDLYIRVNGEPVKFDGAPALDPTHPATKARIKRQLEQFIEWGYEYVKIDFMAHGAYESDKYFDSSITTGTQAYNHGMAYIDSIVDNRMWINLSIAPLFPANYAHSRRISCDAWNKVKDTEYVLNALSGGWWLDRVYHYNDADHVVYEGATDGENRMRITSSAITGVYFLGDDLSKTGDSGAKARAIKNTGNRAINAMARSCKSFRPVEHAVGTAATDMFVNSDDSFIYVAIFNYSEQAVEKTLPLRRIGLSEATDYRAVELWSGDSHKLRGAITTHIAPLDVKVFRIRKK